MRSPLNIYSSLPPRKHTNKHTYSPIPNSPTEVTRAPANGHNFHLSTLVYYFLPTHMPCEDEYRTNNQSDKRGKEDRQP